VKEAPYGNEPEIESYSETSIVAISYFIVSPTFNLKILTYLDAFKAKTLTEERGFDRRREVLEKSGQRLHSSWNSGIMI
jgi:hypothetical protein